MTIDLISVSDKRGLERVYVLLNSIKSIKEADTIINYRLVIEGVDDKVKQYFNDLQSDDFKIEYIDTQWFKERINPPYRNYFYYVRCLFPLYFDKLDKLLYLYTDLVFLQKGIEQLWSKDVTNYSIAAITDIPVNEASCLRPQLNQTKTKNYFNSGVMIMNLKRIRETGKADQLAEWCLFWDKNTLRAIIMDQTLLNYIFRDDVLYLEYKFNDYSLMVSRGVLNETKRYLKKQYGYEEPPNSVKDAIILHFLGELKPWEENKNKQYLFPYRAAYVEIWNKIENQLGKKWEIQ